MGGKYNGRYYGFYDWIVCKKKEHRELNDIFKVTVKELKAVIDNLCSVILDVFKLLLGIHSPYKEWMEKIMGGKYSVEARNLHDKFWPVVEYTDNFFKFIILSIKCFKKYDVVLLGKHGK